MIFHPADCYDVDMDHNRFTTDEDGSEILIPLIDESDISHISRKWLDLPYANLSPTEMLDIYLPNKGEGPFPVILHIHGGAFAIGDKCDRKVLVYLKGLERGYAVVSLNYRMSGEAVFPAGLQD